MLFKRFFMNRHNRFIRQISLILTLTIFTLTLLSQQAVHPAYPQLARPEMEFKIFQFPKNAIPRMDGQTDDWSMVPESYRYKTSLLNDTEDGHGTEIDPEDLDVSVTVGWVKGENRLYFLYEAYDDYWDFDRFYPPAYFNDIFEIVVDGDLSGGNFIFNTYLEENFREIDWNSETFAKNFISFAGLHAQNYHIYTPPLNNGWGYVWGAQPWAGEFPHANFVYDYEFSSGESGRLILECWITPFDHAPYEGPEHAVESTLEENGIIGLSWSILDFDGADRDGHYNLSHDVSMVRDASALCAFRLMPLEEFLLPGIQAGWSFEIIDLERGMVAFRDESIGEVTSWLWDFGDGTSSNEQHPIHFYESKSVRKVVTLEVTGPAGTSKFTRFREILIR